MPVAVSYASQTRRAWLVATQFTLHQFCAGGIQLLCVSMITCTRLLRAGMRAGMPPRAVADTPCLGCTLFNRRPACRRAQVTKLCEFPSGEGGDSVCSVSWSQRGTFLAVGTNNGEVQIWDVAKVKL